MHVQRACTVGLRGCFAGPEACAGGVLAASQQRGACVMCCCSSSTAAYVQGVVLAAGALQRHVAALAAHPLVGRPLGPHMYVSKRAEPGLHTARQFCAAQGLRGRVHVVSGWAGIGKGDSGVLGSAV